MDGTIEKEEYDRKMAEYNARLNRQIAEKEILAENSLKKKSINRRIRDLRHTLETKDPLDQFDRLVFDSIVEKIIVGGYDSEGKPSPYKLTFVLKADQKVVAINNRERYKVLRGFLPFLPTARIRQIKISFSYILAIRTCCFLQHVFYTVPKGIRYKNHVTY